MKLFPISTKTILILMSISIAPSALDIWTLVSVVSLNTACKAFDYLLTTLSTNKTLFVACPAFDSFMSVIRILFL